MKLASRTSIERMVTKKKLFPRLSSFLTALTFLCFLASPDEVQAQPQFAFPTVEVMAGESFCVEVKTEDFTDLLTIDFVITWDPTVIQFTGVQNLSPLVDDFDMSDFDQSDVSNGRLALSWADLDMLGVDIDPSLEPYTLFELCFTNIGSFGQSSPLCIETDPIPVITRSGTGGTNIGLTQVKGLVGTDVLPVTFILEDENVEKGDFFCVDFRVEDFFRITYGQFTIEYDPAVLQFDGVNNPGNLPRMNPSFDFANIEPGVITWSWFNSDETTVPDSTVIYSVCFRAIGDCNDYSFVNITSNYTSIAVGSGKDPDPNAGTNIGVVVENSLVRINPCTSNGGLNLVADCPIAMPGETVCVTVEANDFDDLVETHYLVKWNPHVLEFVSATALNGNYNPNFNSSGASTGTLGVDWVRPPIAGVTLPDGTEIIELCFRVIGDGTLNTSVSFTGSPPVVIKKGSSNNIGIDPDNGCVIVSAPPGLTLSAGDYERFPGEQVCMDVTVANFNGINNLEFSINFSSTNLQFDQVTNINVPGMSAANFTYLGGDDLSVDWETPFGFGESLPDGSVAFTLCFTVIGQPSQTNVQNCSQINFTGDPTPVNITTEDGGTFNIGLNGNPGQVCILNQGDFTVFGSHETGDLGEEVCVDISAVNFNLITGLQFSIDWNDLGLVADFERIEFTGAIPGLTLANFDVSGVDVNILSFSWMDQSGDGLTLPDSTVLFRVCYTVTGNANECTDIGFAENPLDIFVTSTLSGGDDIGLNSFDGSICANDYLRIQDSTVIHVDCPGTDDGEIFLRVVGGEEPYDFNWSGTTQQTEDIANLGPGTYTVTITDANQKEVVATFRVEVSNNAPVAVAGQDRGMNCNSTPVILDGSGSTTGNNIRYKWITIDSGGVVSPSNRTLNPTITGAGTYVLEVLNTNTLCASYDTVVVTPPTYPDLPMVADVETSCLVESNLELDASAAIAPNILFEWESLDGGTIRPGTENSSIAIVTGLGDYMLTVLNSRTGCSSKDTVSVIDGAFYPIADAGPQMSLPCVADTITVGGTNTSTGMRFQYNWQELNGGNIIGSLNQAAAEVNSTGLYVLTVVDTINGCEAIDSVEVIGDPNRPVADAGRDSVLRCNRPSIQLNALNSSSGNRYVYQWTGISGGVIPPGEENILQPTISVPGIYQLMVRDTTTGCDDFDLVVISQNRSLPSVNAGPDVNMGCRRDDVLLEGTAGAFNTTLFYQWSTNGGGTIQEPDSLLTLVNGFGTFYLEVTDSINGCVAIDSVQIIQDTTMKPTVRIAPVNKLLTCKDTVIQLNAIGSSNGGSYVVSWTPMPFQGGTTLTPKVRNAGVYRLTILDTSNGCLDFKEIRVDSNKTKPVVMVDETNLRLACDPPELRLDASASQRGPNISYTWRSQTGFPISNPTGLLPTVTAPDIYTIISTNSTNGCKDSTSVEVLPNNNPITAEAGNDAVVNCSDTSAILSASNSNLPATVKIEWQDETGIVLFDEEEFEVNTAGLYVLFVRDTSDGCTSRDTVMVTEDTDSPLVDAGTDVEFNCSFENTTLNGNVEAGGRSVAYLWYTSNGGTINNPSLSMPVVDAPGTYYLQGTNTENGCIAIDSVNIELLFNLPDAQAMGSIGVCEDFGMLDANLPNGVSGMWTTTSNAAIDFPSENITSVINLESGNNMFVWTLSSDDCPNYSADTVFLSVDGKPELRNDFVTLSENNLTIDIDILANDNLFGGPTDYLYSLISDPNPGFITGDNNGIITYERSQGFEGTDQFFYAVCNRNCPNFCDTASVSIVVERKEATIDSIPNAITPNGDGLNDVLIFDILNEDPERYARNELTVFNRWGDVVYQAKPYLNDWDGTNQNGKALPQGTYYFILRLNVSEGEIVRGNITILR